MAHARSLTSFKLSMTEYLGNALLMEFALCGGAAVVLLVFVSVEFFRPFLVTFDGLYYATFSLSMAVYHAVVAC